MTDTSRGDEIRQRLAAECAVRGDHMLASSRKGCPACSPRFTKEEIAWLLADNDRLRAENAELRKPWDELVTAHEEAQLERDRLRAAAAQLADAGQALYAAACQVLSVEHTEDWDALGEAAGAWEATLDAYCDLTSPQEPAQ